MYDMKSDCPTTTSWKPPSTNSCIQSMLDAKFIFLLLGQIPKFLTQDLITSPLEAEEHSTAYSHRKDFNHAIEMEEFQELVKVNDVTKPVAVILYDGGPDENPRFPKTLDVSIQHFKEYNFDVIFVSTLAPGMSAYNNAERKRMARLKKALACVLLPHGILGTHLDSQRRTTYVKLEKQNFKAAEKLLIEIWSELVLDKFLVVS